MRIRGFVENTAIVLIVVGRRELTEDGLELTFAANHIGHWLVMLFR